MSWINILSQQNTVNDRRIRWIYYKIDFICRSTERKIIVRYTYYYIMNTAATEHIPLVQLPYI